ncbi:MAG: FHA domain-containing protein [Chloroflexota bacterium]
MTQPPSPEDKGTVRIDDMLEELELAEQRDGYDALEDAIVPWVIELRVVGTPDLIRVPTGEKLTIGRKDRDHNIFPEVDLTPYNAKMLGVSRKHARFTMMDNRLTLEDLGSSNGTFLNGKHIRVRNPIRVHSGDEIKFGGLTVQVNFLMQPFSNEDTMHGMGNTVNVPTIGNKETVLIIDDNQAVCAVVRMVAVRAGFRVLVAHRTAEAVSYWDNEGVDGIFMELMLEEDNALDFVSYVRQQHNSDVPIVATSANTGGFYENKAMSGGVTDIVAKPLSVDKIMAVLKNFVKQAS